MFALVTAAISVCFIGTACASRDGLLAETTEAKAAASTPAVTPLAVSTNEFSDYDAVVSGETVWRYLDNDYDPASDTDDRLSWTLPSYDDSGWTTGIGSFGAKDGELVALSDGTIPNVLLTQYDSDGHSLPTYFFRATFDIEQPDSIHSLVCSIAFDDAVIVYINGTAVYSSNLSPDGYSSNLSYGAASSYGDPLQESFTVSDVSMLTSGRNVIAVELHQSNAHSSDIFFDFDSLTVSAQTPAKETISVLTPFVMIGADPSQLTVSWFSTVKDSDRLLYAAADQTGAPIDEFQAAETQISYSETTGFYAYSAALTGLSEGAYAYYIENPSGTTETYVVNVGSAQAAETTFLFAGDPQVSDSSSTSWDESLSSMFALYPKAAFLLSAGDQVDDGALESQYDGFASAVRLRSVPLGTTIGNHDAGNLYYDHFILPNFDRAIGDYSFTYGNMLIVTIDSNLDEFSEHETFIRNAVDDYTQRIGTDPQWLILVMHHSIFSVGYHDLDQETPYLREAVTSICERFDIDLVLSGHEHSYTRSFVMQGDTPVENQPVNIASFEKSTGQTLSICAGSSSGTKYYDSDMEGAEYAAFSYHEHTPTMVAVTVGETSLSISMVATETRITLDTFTLEKPDL